MTIKRALAALVAMALAVYPVPGSAELSMSSAMGTFWNGVSNVTGPTAFQGQSAGHYTLGSVYARTPVINRNLVNLTLPSFRAGCGGIDMFAGAFSFINADQFVALLKGIANNAAGFAFKLALETISPVISQELGELNDVIQKINQSSINSCQTAQMLVNGDFSQIDQATETACEKLGNLTGIFSDYADARQGCGAGGDRSSTLSGAPADHKDEIPVARNYAWNALQKNSYFSSSSTAFQQEAMTLTGTVIVNLPSSDNANITKTHYSPKALDHDVLEAMLHGGTITYLSCDEFTNCLYPVENGASENISQAGSLSGQVNTLMSGIITAIQTDAALTAQQQAFLNSTTLPVYKMLTVWTTYSPGDASAQAMSYSDIVAMDLLFTMIDQILNQAQQGTSQVASADGKNLDKWKAELAHTRDFIAQAQLQWKQQLTQTMAMIDNTQKIERMLSSQLSSRMASNLAFSRGVVKH